MKRVSTHIPEQGKSLVKYKGTELIDRLGRDAITDVVTSILCGGNVRAMTEKLTRRRIALSNSSMLITFINALSKGISASELYSVIESELKPKKGLTSAERNYLQWIVGLTTKSIQNVLRGDISELEGYIQELEDSININTSRVGAEYGDLGGRISLNSETVELNWNVFLRLTLALGTQSLAIRGAEKSMYGKLFEKLVLGSILTILDFECISRDDVRRDSGVFWLSERGSKRESDATLLLQPGRGVRFDIGFIGVGNTEISLDKVSRFEREMERGQQRHFMKTIILIDRIGEGSRIQEMAREIDGEIVQMSMTFWVHNVANILHQTFNWKHPILSMTREASIDYIQRKMAEIDLTPFIMGMDGDDDGQLDLEY